MTPCYFDNLPNYSISKRPNIKMAGLLGGGGGGNGNNGGGGGLLGGYIRFSSM